MVTLEYVPSTITAFAARSVLNVSIRLTLFMWSFCKVSKTGEYGFPPTN